MYNICRQKTTIFTVSTVGRKIVLDPVFAHIANRQWWRMVSIMYYYWLWTYIYIINIWVTSVHYIVVISVDSIRLLQLPDYHLKFAFSLYLPFKIYRLQDSHQLIIPTANQVSKTKYKSYKTSTNFAKSFLIKTCRVIFITCNCIYTTYPGPHMYSNRGVQ